MDSPEESYANLASYCHDMEIIYLDLAFFIKLTTVSNTSS